MAKPFLKWAGGKSKLVPFIEQHIPRYRNRLVEPFVGSASVSLGLDFDEYLLNDNNADLINLYQTLKNERHEFIDYAQSFFNDNNNSEQRFYELRELFNHTPDIVEKSALFVYLNRHCFNGLCCYNSKGFFNVPFGKYKSPYFPKDEFMSFIKKSDKMQFFCTDFENIFLKINNEDVVYCDPPYLPLTDTANFTTYNKNGFNLDDHYRLAKVSKSCKEKSRKILISNHDTPLAHKLYCGVEIKRITVQRNISAKSESRKKVGEILVIF